MTRGSAVQQHHRTMRPRREVSSATLWLLQPFFRFSGSRDAWVLRGIGNRMGPVLVLKN